ncbi:MAG: TonB-dependent receptor [Gemmatimonadales bacterium]|nr:TonB-dependent receptor [Gemmatimonadales bacterium]
MYPILRFLLLAVSLLAIVGIVHGMGIAGEQSEFQDFAELNLESLLDQTIITASKYEQKISETPVAATVVTADEIAASGARSIPELLRLVPGLDVIQTSSSSFDVSARGMNKAGSNAMLVLVDGRSVYVELYGLTMWDQLSISLEDIKAIEVIKGPGSAMYGANAFAGVINIITFTPDEKSGTTVRTMATNLGESNGVIRNAGRVDDTSWKFSTTWDRSDNWESGMKDAEIVRFDGQVRYDLTDDSQLAFGGGHTNGTSTLVPSDAMLFADGNNSYVRAGYNFGSFEARWYMNRWGFDFQPLTVNITTGQARFESNMHDLELQHSLGLGEDHFLLWGGSYRHQETNFSQQGITRKQDIYAGFVLEEWNPNDQLYVSAGLRYEHHPVVGGHLSPRGGVVFKPHADHALRVSFSKAYRDPSYLETYWSTEVEVMPGMIQVVRGDLNVNSEVLQAYEAGYQGLVAEDMLLSLAVFRNDMEDLIGMQPVEFFSSPPAPPGIPSVLAFMNEASWQATGGEIGIQVEPADWLRLSGGYSYVWLEDVDSGDHLTQAPAHTAYFSGTVRPWKDHQIRLVNRFRSQAEWTTGELSAGETGLADERFFLDAIWSVRRSDDCRYTLAVENMLDRRIRDYPLGIEQRRRILLSVVLEY